MLVYRRIERITDALVLIIVKLSRSDATYEYASNIAFVFE